MHKRKCISTTKQSKPGGTYLGLGRSSSVGKKEKEVKEQIFPLYMCMQKSKLLTYY